MDYKRILLPFTGSDRHVGILPAAFKVGKTFNACCEVLFIRPELYQALPYLGDAAPGVVVKEIVESVNQAADASMAHLRTAVAEASKAAGARLVEDKVPSGKFVVRVVEQSGDSISVAAERSRLVDLGIFVGGEGHSEIVTSGALTGLLMKTGRPALVIPGTSYAGNVGQNVIIAWDGGTESANAVRGALPFLKRAMSVRVLKARRFDEESALPISDVESLGIYLDVHDIERTEATIDAGSRGVAKALLEEAVGSKADLLVMGAYGHSRVREFIVGGVTQHILEHTTIPVLIAH